MTKIVVKHVRIVGGAEGSHRVVVADGKVAKMSLEGESAGLGEDCDGVQIIDGSDLWLSPSLIDWHTHQKLNAVASHRLNLKSARSCSEALRQVSEALLSPKYDPRIEPNFVAVNLRVGSWTDFDDLNRSNLDRVLSERPIYLILNGYHSMCCNSLGLKVGGIDPQGHDGMVKEDEAFELTKKLSNVPVDTVDQWIADEANKAASLGVTEIVDLEMDHNLAAWQRRYANGFRTLRVHIGFYDAHLADAVSLGLRTGDDVPHCDGLIKVGPYKIITDGGLGSQTAFCHDPYPGTNDYGLFTYPQKTLKEMVQRGTEAGFKLAVHAIGDEANSLTLQALAESSRPLDGSTIEHAQLLTFSDLPLFKSLGLTASIQPCHLVDDRELCHRFWPGREGRAYAFKSIVDAGIPIKLGSDCPVAPLNPWEAMAVAISRAGVGEEPFCGAQIIELESAWRGSTSNGKTRLEQGDAADLLLLGANPLSCTADGLRKMQVVGTMLDGKWSYRHPSLAARME